MRPEFFVDGIMGAEWLKNYGKTPNPKDLRLTHIELGTFEATDLDNLFVKMQGEVWSPNGEARPLIEFKGLKHTSMSVGDIAVTESGDTFICDRIGWMILLGKETT